MLVTVKCVHCQVGDLLFKILERLSGAISKSELSHTAGLGDLGYIWQKIEAEGSAVHMWQAVLLWYGLTTSHAQLYSSSYIYAYAWPAGLLRGAHIAQY